jgi:hypothetical protein
MTSVLLTRGVIRPDTRAAPRSARWFYAGAAVAVLLMVFAGFAPSFYLRPAAKPGLSLRVVAHGTLFSSWIVLFLVQTGLVAAGRVRLHRRLGVAAALVAATMIATGPIMAVGLARRGQPPPDPLGFMLVILVDLFLFAVFVGAGIYYRGRPAVHKRLMLLGTISVLPPAISRWPIAVRYPPVIFGVLLAFVASAVAYDVWTRRRPHPATLWGGLALLASGPLRFAIASTGTWHHIASWLTR